MGLSPTAAGVRGSRLGSRFISAHMPTWRDAVVHDDAVRDEAHPQLMRLAATNLFDYIFDTENLSVARASSYELEHLVDELVKSVDGVDVVYVAASEALMVAPNEKSAETACGTMRDAFLGGSSSLPCATAVLGRVALGEDASLATATARLENHLRRDQMRQASVVPAGLAGTGPCELDGVRPATETLHVGSAKYRVSEHTHSRGRSGQAMRSTHAVDLLDEAAADTSIADWDQSFEGLAAFAAPGPVAGKMCVLHADGNRFSDYRSRLLQPDHLGLFAKAVREAQRLTLRDALRGLWQQASAQRCLPFHLLYWAGDEFSLVLPAAHGLAVARELLESFSGHLRAELEATPDELARRALVDALGAGALTLAVGMVFCDSHQPIRRATALAEALCEEAKKRFERGADPNDPGTANVVDFVVIENGMVPDDLAVHRSRHLARPDGTVAGMRPLDLEQFIDLLDDVAALKRVKFPTGRGHAFVEAILSCADGADGERRLQEACAKIYARVDWDLIDAVAQDSPEIRARMGRLRPLSVESCAAASVFVASWPERCDLWDYVSVTEGVD